MRAFSLIFGCLLVACASVPEAQPQPVRTPDGWVSVARGSLVEVAVERALYEEAGHPHFFVHVRVQNLGGAPIGVDLRKYHGVFFPNQWGASSAPHRGAVDERRFLPEGPLDAAGQAEIVAAHRAGLLTNVSAHGFIEYYEEFNASGRSDVDAQSAGAKYVLVVIDGHMRATDGRVAERLDAPLEDAPREIAVSAPVRWARIPPGALVIRDR